MSTDHTVTIHVAAEAVTRLVSNNSPALAARLALADFEAEFGRLPPGSYVEVAWRADDEGRPGSCRYDDLAAVRVALPGAEPAPSPAVADWPYQAWKASNYDPYEPPSPSAAWAAALAWAAGRAEAAGPGIMRPIREALAGEWRDDQGYTRWGAVEAETMNAVADLTATIRAGRP